MTENWRVKIARFFDGTPLPASALLGLAFGFASALRGLGGIDPGDLDLLAAQRRDRRVHRVGDALAGDRLSGPRAS